MSRSATRCSSSLQRLPATRDAAAWAGAGVGGGNSGTQIADELGHTHPTTLAVGSRLPYLPQRLAGRTTFWWLDHLGLLTVPVPPPAGRWWRRRDFLVGDRPRRLGRRGVALTGRVVAAEEGRLRCQDGSLHQPHTVIWAAGFTPDFSWVDLPVVAPDGWILQWAGRTRLPGLHVLGLPWQRSGGSALLGWVGHDAARLVRDITRHHRSVQG